MAFVVVARVEMAFVVVARVQMAFVEAPAREAEMARVEAARMVALPMVWTACVLAARVVKAT